MKHFALLLLLLFIPFSIACEDTDTGKNKYELGQVTDGKEIYVDECVDNNIKEYFCSVEGIATYSILPCVNGCKDGVCQLANEQPKQQAPIIDKFPNINIYLSLIIALIIIGLYIYFFKFRKKKDY